MTTNKAHLLILTVDAAAMRARDASASAHAAAREAVTAIGAVYQHSGRGRSTDESTNARAVAAISTARTVAAALYDLAYAIESTACDAAAADRASTFARVHQAAIRAISEMPTTGQPSQ